MTGPSLILAGLLLLWTPIALSGGPREGALEHMLSNLGLDRWITLLAVSRFGFGLMILGSMLMAGGR